MNASSKRGFTLLELIVVIVVAGILAGIAIPSFNAVKTKTAESSVVSSAESIVRNARALAALDDSSLSDAYVDQAGSETSDYNSSSNSVTHNSAVAAIDPLTGVVTISGEPSISLVDLSALSHFPWIGSGDNTATWDSTHRVLWRTSTNYTWMNDSYWTDPAYASNVANYCSQSASTFIRYTSDPTQTPTTGTTVCP